ncbi:MULTISPECIES: cystathionine beta-lyase [Chelativorans]|jgi:cystathionine beta-lyase|uniref:Cystathionine beta-lyase n=1 Tax=Chelativorans sp. (strain BNC1) TaxID=266779 RepID=Q11C77_CHESB|nr:MULTISPECIES: cystathionine beta-lyase [Chelativorans]
MAENNEDMRTTLVHAGRGPQYRGNTVSPPVHRASTFLFDTLAEMDQASKTPFRGVFYGRNGTPTSVAFEDAMAKISNAHGAIATASGVSAIMGVMLGLLNSGDHVLIPDSVYDIVRRSADGMLARMGIEYEYYDPVVGAGIESLLRPNTRLIYLESPGSGTFEVQDVPAIVAVAKARNIRTAIDNTWATPVFFRPLELGVDAVIEAGTKYIVGHSDAMLGVVAANELTYGPIRQAIRDFGAVVGTEEANLGLRGLRTMEVRLQRHFAAALEIATWLEGQPGVARVMHPALPSFPGHTLWKRDFSGASGLFSIELANRDPAAMTRFVDSLKLFKIGFSWGGFESLVLPAHPERRKVAVWTGGPVVRFHIGLEAIDDLKADLAAALPLIA